MGDNFIRFSRHPAVIVTLLDQKPRFYVRVLSINDFKCHNPNLPHNGEIDTTNARHITHFVQRNTVRRVFWSLSSQVYIQIELILQPSLLSMFESYQQPQTTPQRQD